MIEQLISIEVLPTTDHSPLTTHHITHFFFLSMPSIITGKKIRLVNVAINKVNEVSQPNAIVPPKLLNTKMTKPATNTREV